MNRGIDDFLIHGGNSSVLARGKRKAESGKRTEVDGIPSPQSPAPSPSIPWSIGLRHPLRPDQRLAEFTLQDQALGTSGSGSQFFHHQGKRYGHILDARTGWPAEQVLSATIIAPTAAEADALFDGVRCARSRRGRKLLPATSQHLSPARHAKGWRSRASSGKSTG